MIRVSDDTLKAQIVRDEGKRLKAYLDTQGFWTIGVGHLLGPTARMLEITEEECDALLDHDIQTAFRGMIKVLGDDWHKHDYARVTAVVNMVFNLGEQKLSKFTHFLSSMKSQNYEQAALDMMNSLWAKQVPARAARLRDAILKGGNQ